MKKILSIAIITICMFGFGLNVFADETCPATTNIMPNQPGYDALKQKYDSSPIRTSISSTSEEKCAANLTLYGKADCNNNSCNNIIYGASKNSSVDSAIANSVTCANGENNIIYNIVASGKDPFVKANASSNITNGTSYWSEIIKITCTSSSKGDYVIDLTTKKGIGTKNNGAGGSTESDSSSTGSGSSSTGSGSSTTGSGSGTSSGSGTGSSSSSGSGYNSSSTVNNESTGINTYFVVLGLVGVISYIFMMCVKKYNLFKNI